MCVRQRRPQGGEKNGRGRRKGRKIERTQTIIVIAFFDTYFLVFVHTFLFFLTPRPCKSGLNRVLACS
jgi:hypothetical protein